MAKKLLSEAQVRRFAKLANISSLNENPARNIYSQHHMPKGGKGSGDSDNVEQKKNEAYNKKDEENMEEVMYKKDDENMEEGSYKMSGRDEDKVMQEEAAEEMEMDAAEAGMDELPGEDEDELEMDAGDTDLELSQDMVDAIAAALPALQMIADAADGGDDMDMDEPEMDMAGDDMMEDEVMEALEGIDYIPESQEIVAEVARRVAKRLLKAKQAEKQLQEALGQKRRRRK